MKKYLEFKKIFQGDKKLNIVALDKDENVLAHRAVMMDNLILDSGALNNILSSLRDEVQKSERGQIEKFEVIYPTNE